MKKIYLLLSLLSGSLIVRADEGMWLPVLLQQLNIEDMRANGFKLTAEDIYSVNKSSMKDAVVLFGGGCTGELVSNEGLLLTNHHCGFSSVNALSSLEHNYLRDGFWAKNKNEELPCPGLTVTFIISMHDVTDSIIPFLQDTMTEAERTAAIKQLSAKLEKQFKGDTPYDASVKAFYYGNAFYLFVTETFKDIRLVGVPPESVGNFGGETDNWAWPRHTGDFSIFRIYADSTNHSAAYSETNKPYTPKYFFPISLNGIKENDFTMVYGFPGRTQEYLPSAAVDLIINSVDPNRVMVRSKRINIMDHYMLNNDTVTLMYASKAKSLANAYKKWKGEMTGLKLNNTIGLKKNYEEQFGNWTMTEKGMPYRGLLEKIDSIYAVYRPYSKINDFTSEAAYGIELINYAGGFQKLIDLCSNDTTTDATLQKEAARLLKAAEGFFAKYYLPLDREMFAAMMKIYCDSVPSAIQPEYVLQQKARYKNDFILWRDDMYAKTLFSDLASVRTVLENITKKKGLELANDPAFLLYENIAVNFDLIRNMYILPMNAEIDVLMRKYMQAQMAFEPDHIFYPDANSTLRVAYGKVQGYYPKDGVYYTYRTTSAGLIEKYADGNEEFDLPDTLLALLASKDFGKYADETGNLPVAFIATNHTTGGNSGSPVINANGELIGINFDRVWEGTMSDILFDPDRCRNISLDIRYTLWIIDKYAGAGNLLSEMKIIE